MKFELVIKHRFRSFQLTAEIIETTPMMERIRIKGYWQRSITLQTNRPFFVNRQLKHRRWEWDLISGSVKESGFLEELIKQLEVKLRAI